MNLARVLDVLAGECAALRRGIDAIAEPDWQRPTRCDPWTARDLLGHVCVVLAWLPAMLDAEPPDRAEVSAAGYYRPDHRFDAATNAARIALGRERLADVPEGDAGDEGEAHGGLAAEFAKVWSEVEARCRREPDERVVRTRHGDAMLLSDFLVTRVVEVAVHGLDLADALTAESWLTPAAADAVLGLLLGAGTARADQLGWGKERLLRKATGREPLTAEESEQLRALDIHWLALG